MTEVPSPFDAVLDMPTTPLLADEAQEAARATLAIAERLTATPQDELATIDNGVLVQAIKLLAKVEASREADPGTVTSMQVIAALANPKSEEKL
ncbi:hypothetical protein VZH09_01205 [Synechococcus elongatus IITB7]|uniref:hypothetical protein n=1 Tax=Synechococcus elongatus TaxID=32046 RepID=UPI0030CB4607